MVTISIIILVIVCIALMAIVLMQSSKGGGLASAFGGSGVTTMFGARRTSDFLQKSTIVLAVIFLLASLVLNLAISKQEGGSESIIQRNSGDVTMPAPNVPLVPQQNQQPTDQNQNPQGQTQERPGQ